MGIAEDIERHKNAGPKSKQCRVVSIMEDSMSPQDRVALEFAIDETRAQQELPQSDRTFTIAFVHKVMVNNGCDIGKTAVSDHIRKVCACEH